MNKEKIKREKARKKAEKLFSQIANQTTDIGVLEELIELINDYILILQEG